MDKTPKIAVELINKAYLDKAEFIDLGNCGLTTVPEEIQMLSPFLKKMSLGTRHFYGSDVKYPLHIGPKNNFSDATGSFDNLLALKNLETLYLNDININEQGIKKIKIFHRIKELNLSFNNLTDTGAEAFAGMSNLSTLAISDNHITDKGFNFIARLNQLNILSIGDNLLTSEASSQLVKFPNLKILGISGNPITDKGAFAIAALQGLFNLNISRSTITDTGIEALLKLQKLNNLKVAHNPITDKGAELIGSFPGINVLDISVTQISDTGCRSVMDMEQLRELDLSYNKITGQGLENARSNPSLKTLNLGHTQITDAGLAALTNYPNLSNLSIPKTGAGPVAMKTIGRLTQLTDLDLNENRITDAGTKYLPDLKSLNKLYLSDCRLTDKSAEYLSKLSGLTTLEVPLNDIRQEGAGQLAALANLQRLNISYNRLADAGVLSITKIKSLEKLNISGNQVSDASANALAGLNHLNYLNLENNMLTDDGIVSIVRTKSPLTKLYVIGNQITDKGAIAIATLGNLTELSIDNSLITDKGLLAITTKLQHLSNVAYDEDKITGVPVEIRDDVQAMRAFFKSTIKIDNTLVKMILIGNSTAGKTTLADFLINGKYAPRRNSTHGIRLWKWKLTDGGSPVNVNIWDFGGQDYYHATHNLFLDDQSMYLLLSASGGHEPSLTPNYWLGNVRDSLSKNAPVWFIATKEDKINTSKSVPLKEEWQQRFHVAHSFSISVKRAYDLQQSNKTDHRFEDFKERLERQIRELAAGAGKLPASWAEIRDTHLPKWRKEKDLYVGEKIFKQKCVKALEKNAPYLRDLNQSWAGLLPYLKGCGEVIYFGDNNALNDKIFLSPAKVTQGIYTYILTKKVLKNHGKFKMSELVLPDKESANLYLEILKAYQLVFKSPDGEGVYIAPQYLDNSLFLEKSIKHIINKTPFIIRFPDYMPMSVISRFLVTYACKSTEDEYWRYGAMFKLHELHVMVKIDFNAQTVYINIVDDNKPAELKIINELFYFFALSSRIKKRYIEQPVALMSSLAHNKTEGGSYMLNSVSQEIQISNDDEWFVSIQQLKIATATASTVIAVNNKGEEKYIPMTSRFSTLFNQNMPKKIFFSYAHKDQDYKKELDNHFEALRLDKKAITWNDAAIKPGENMDETIRYNLYDSDIALLLISPDFMVSKYIWQVEIPEAIKRGVSIVPIFLRHCDFTESVFGIHERLGLPGDRKGEMRWLVSKHFPYIDEGYLEVVNGVKKILASNP